MTDNQKTTRVSYLGYKILVVLMLVTSPIVFWGASLSFRRFENDIYQWLPKGFKEAQDYAWFKDHFGVDEMVVVSWPGCSVDDVRLENFATALREHRNSEGQLSFERIVTGPEMVDQIAQTISSEKNAMLRARGLFVSADESTTCCICYPSEEASHHRSDLIDTIIAVGCDITGLTADDLHMGGPTVDGAAIDQESKSSLKNYLWMTILVVMGLTWMRTKNVILSLLILMMSIYCAALGLAVLYWTGGTMNLTMIMLPTLTFILAVSGAVHMTNYFIKAFRQESSSATGNAIRYGGYPVILSSLTTAVGMGSLASSQIWPIKMFGVYSAVAVMVSLPVLLIGLPVLLGWLSRHTRLIFGSENESDGYQAQSPMVMALSATVLRWHVPVVVISLVALVGLGLGVYKLKATVNVQNRFDESTKIIRDYTWLEQNLGPLVPMEVILLIPSEHELTYWQRTELTGLVEKQIRDSQYVNASFSAATFQPPLRGSKIAKESVKLSWERHRPDLQRSRLISGDRESDLWRISLRIKAMDKTDYSQLLVSVNEVVDNVLKQVNEQVSTRSNLQISAVLTGGVPMMYKAQHQVLSDLMVSFLWAFALITLVMIVVLQNIPAGMAAMLPNIFPPLIVFGSMGWMGLPIEIGSVMTASVALGIAVDDTIHFLAWYRRGAGQNLDKRHAILYAFKNCAKSMVDTTLICGLGTAPFMFSVFMPTVRFARLMAILLGVGLIGDLVLLPALLNSGMGDLFRRRLRKKEISPQPELAPEPEPEAVGSN